MPKHTMVNAIQTSIKYSVAYIARFQSLMLHLNLLVNAERNTGGQHRLKGLWIVLGSRFCFLSVLCNQIFDGRCQQY